MGGRKPARQREACRPAAAGAAAGKPASAHTLPLARRLTATSRLRLSRGTKRQREYAPLEREDRSRRDESLRPVSSFAACSALLTRPPSGTPAAGERAAPEDEYEDGATRCMTETHTGLRPRTPGRALGRSWKVTGAIPPRVFRHRVRVAARQNEHLEPRSGCPIESAIRRAGATQYERRSLSRPQRPRP